MCSLRAQKKYAQHFLVPAWADKLVDAIAPRPNDRFLEIGPGPGALTLRLAPKVNHLIAVELDAAMVQALAPQLPPNVELVEQDFLAFDLEGLMRQGALRVAGNLPYNVTSPILLKLIAAHRAASLHSGSNLRDATVMVQLEVADRICASPGSKDYGVLSISLQLYADVERLVTLPPGAFRPPPRVHSAVIRLTFRPPAVAPRDEAVFAAMVRAMFMQRRKTLGNALRAFATASGTTAAAALARAGIEPGRRAETLQLAELARLADVFASADDSAVL
jgi:16S rRNA (adenine1518-N6/adenine1519-N6)-dimethyltransferase